MSRTIICALWQLLLVFGFQTTNQSWASNLNPNGRTPHEILGVGPGASREDIIKAHRQAVQLYHPDKATQQAQVNFKERSEIMARFNDARDSLLNEFGSDNGFDLHQESVGTPVAPIGISTEAGWIEYLTRQYQKARPNGPIYKPDVLLATFLESYENLSENSTYRSAFVGFLTAELAGISIIYDSHSLSRIMALAQKYIPLQVLDDYHVMLARKLTYAAYRAYLRFYLYENRNYPAAKVLKNFGDFVKAVSPVIYARGRIILSKEMRQFQDQELILSELLSIVGITFRSDYYNDPIALHHNQEILSVEQNNELAPIVITLLQSFPQKETLDGFDFILGQGGLGDSNLVNAVHNALTEMAKNFPSLRNRVKYILFKRRFVQTFRQFCASALGQSGSLNELPPKSPR